MSGDLKYLLSDGELFRYSGSYDFEHFVGGKWVPYTSEDLFTARSMPITADRAKEIMAEGKSVSVMESCSDLESARKMIREEYP